MVSGPLTQEVPPTAPDPHRHSQRHPHSLQVLHQISLDQVRLNFCSSLYKIRCKHIQTPSLVAISTILTWHHFLAGSSSKICTSCFTSITITAIVSYAVSFILGALVVLCTVRKKSNCQKFYSLTIARKQQQQQLAPVYEDVVGQSQNIELKKN